MSKENDLTPPELPLDRLSGHTGMLEVRITDALNSHLLPLSDNLQVVDLDKIALNALLIVMLRIIKRGAANSDYHRAFTQAAIQQLLNVQCEAEGGYPAHAAPPLLAESTADGLMEQISETIRLFQSEQVKRFGCRDISQEAISALVGLMGVTVRNIDSAAERQRLMKQIEEAVACMPQLVEEARADLGLDGSASDTRAARHSVWHDDH